jgi:multimeric flavodoxin WrbA
MNRRFSIVLGSTREGGNSEILAKHALEGLPERAETRWLRLRDMPLPPFVDVRHEGTGEYPAPTGHAQTLLDATLWATDLVFATPTYWYSLPAPVKLYLDHWSAWMRVPGVDFKKQMQGKALWVITVNSDDPGDDASSGPLLRTLELTAEYMHMRFAGALVGHGNRPGDATGDASAIRAARTFFRTSGPTPPASTPRV